MDTDNVSKLYSPQELEDAIKLIWLDNTFLIRAYANDVIDHSVESVEYIDKMKENIKKIGDILEHYYGADTAQQFLTAYNSFIDTYQEYIRVGVSGGDTKEIETKLMNLADEMVIALTNENSYLNEKQMKALLRELVTLSKEVFLKRARKQYSEEMALYNIVNNNLLLFAEILSEGIIKKFYGQSS